VKGLEKLLQHYGCPTVVGKKLQVSLELLVIELGMSTQVFHLDYNKYHFLATDCWLKSLREKVHRFKFRLTLRNVKCEPPRVGDDWLMPQFFCLGFTEGELVRLNRVRLYQHVLFVSDVMDAGGRALDRRYTDQRPATEQWTTLLFPLEKPSRADFAPWKASLLQVRLVLQYTTTRLLHFRTAGHKRWDWGYDEEGGRVFHYTDDGRMDIYTPSLVRGFERRPNCWTRARIGAAVIPCEVLCTMRPAGRAVWSICSYAPAAVPPPLPTSFWGVMQDWAFELWQDGGSVLVERQTFSLREGRPLEGLACTLNITQHGDVQ
jgi:hypothetical protein